MTVAVATGAPRRRTIARAGFALLVGILLVLLVPSAAAAATAPARAPQTTLEEVEEKLMCSTCKVPLNQSDAPQAQQERKTIERLIAEGKTKDQIIDEMVEIYSESVLIDPPDESVRALRWVLPGLAALIALVTVAVLVRRWRARGAHADDGAAESPDPDAYDDGLDDDDRRRLDDDMASSR